MKVEWNAHEKADRMSSISMLPLKARKAAKALTLWVLALPSAALPPLLSGTHGGSASSPNPESILMKLLVVMLALSFG